MNDLILQSTDANGVTLLKLNRPDVHNAFDDRLIAALSETLSTLADSDSTRLLVITGEGRQFCAGADLNWMKKTALYSSEQSLLDAQKLARMLTQLNTFPAPTLARVQGVAFGGGVGLVACCDIAIASLDATFALSEVRLGLIPSTISPFVLAAIGARAARRWFLTGERFNCEQALRLGLLHEAVAADRLDAAVDDMIQSLLLGGPFAQRQAKMLIRDIQYQEHTASLEKETAKRIADIRATPEGQEGIAAFLAKRKPDWILHND